MKSVDDALTSWEVPPAPADLADRVLARLERPHGRWWMAALLVPAAAAAAFFLLRGSRQAGHVVASARQSIAIGARAVAVAEPGAELSFVVERSGAARVEQRRGNVFYRVERGGPFVVTAPSGDEISVLGTCFRVEVDDMQRKTWIAGATGAAISAAVLVTVYEGRVRLANARGATEIGAGEQSQAGTTATPAQAWTNTLLAARVQKLQGELRETQQRLAQAHQGAEDSIERRFAVEERDPAWATREEQLVRERLVRHLGVDKDRMSVECRKSCCELMLDRAGFEKARNELWTDVGIGHFVSKGFAVSQQEPEKPEEVLGSATFCLQPEDLTPRNDPDRAAEREALLLATRGAMTACMHGRTEPLRLDIHLSLEASGAIKRVSTTVEPVGHPAAACAEQALLAAANFAPSSKDTSLTITVRLP